MLKISHPEPGTTKITFSLPNDHPAGLVSVVGNFNDWTPGVTAMRRRANGQMSAKVVLPDAYELHFRYLGEGGWWFDEPDADRIDPGASVILARPTAPKKPTPKDKDKKADAKKDKASKPKKDKASKKAEGAKEAAKADNPAAKAQKKAKKTKKSEKAAAKAHKKVKKTADSD